MIQKKAPQSNYKLHIPNLFFQTQKVLNELFIHDLTLLILDFAIECFWKFPFLTEARISNYIFECIKSDFWKDVLLVGENVVFKWGIWWPLTSIKCVYGNRRKYLEENTELVDLRQPIDIQRRKKNNENGINFIISRVGKDAVNLNLADYIVKLCQKYNLSFLPSDIVLAKEKMFQFPDQAARCTTFYENLLSPP